MTPAPRLTEIDAILDFWLAEVGPDGWYAQSDAIDAEIVRRFGQLWHDARRDQVQRWFVSPRGALAHLILLDQFSRNMFRGDARAFSTDALALRRAITAIERNLDMGVPEPERRFFYMPLMHSERLSDQDRCIALVMLRMPQDRARTIPHGVAHRDVIRRFGRFPSRNAALGRSDRPEEIAYRNAGGYMG